MPPRKQNVYEFKVSLRDIEPAVWRRIQVVESVSLFDLHVAIQSAMGWSDVHLHVFRFGEGKDIPTEIGTPDQFGMRPVLPSWDLSMSAYFQRPGARAVYEYDFGDGWVHDVVLEAIAPRPLGQKYPRCLDGARACPPENCGGPPGYEELLRTLADASAPDHQETILWIGRPFHPDVFDPSSVRFMKPESRLRQWRRG